MAQAANAVPLAEDLPADPRLCCESHVQPEEALKLQQHEQAGMGHDVPFQRALAIWVIQHRAQWRKNRERRL